MLTSAPHWQATELSPSDPNAWATLHRTVRDIDEDKVRDCKEDMDSLLVFAGLYSAVLTAFLIESYQKLQPDPQSAMVGLLQQIANQTASYTLQGPVANASGFVVPLPPFEADAADVRVNVCWFSSLILSLSTASFSILVKQWLREYLAIDRISPRERLRVRHFRYRGLEEWQLFGIAAALPFLLQVSVGVFLVGLCFFALSVHISIGRTCVILVVGWALSFLYTLLAPIVSHRCPYKTALLKTPVAFLRVKFFDAARHLSRVLPRTSSNDEDNIPLLDTRSEDDQLDSRSTASSVDTFWRLRARLDRALLGHLFEQYVQEERPKALAEEDLHNDDSYDAFVLKALDLSLVDDGFWTTARDALQQSPLSGLGTLQLALEMVKRRIVPPQTSRRFQEPRPNLAPLSRSACLALTDIVADRVIAEVETVPPSEWKEQRWTTPALLFLVAISPTRPTMSHAVAAVFQRLLFTPFGVSPDGCAILAAFVAGNQKINVSGHGLGRLLIATLPVLTRSPVAGIIMGAEALKYVVHWHCFSLDDLIVPSTDTYGRLLDAFRDNESLHHPVSPTSLSILTQSATSILYAAIEDVRVQDRNPHGLDSSPVLEELLDFVIEGAAKSSDLFAYHLTLDYIPGAVTLDKLFFKLLTTPSLVHRLFGSIARFPDFVSSNVVDNLLLEGAGKINLEEEHTVQLLEAYAKFFKSGYDHNVPRLSLLQTLRLSHLVYRFGTKNTRPIVSHWHKLFEEITKIVRYHTNKTPKASVNPAEQHTAYDLLVVIDREHKREFAASNSVARLIDIADDLGDADYPVWRQNFNPSFAHCPDKMITLLAKIAPAKKDGQGRTEADTLWRVRRLQEHALPLSARLALPDDGPARLQKSFSSQEASSSRRVRPPVRPKAATWEEGMLTTRSSQEHSDQTSGDESADTPVP